MTGSSRSRAHRDGRGEPRSPVPGLARLPERVVCGSRTARPGRCHSRWRSRSSACIRPCGREPYRARDAQGRLRGTIAVTDVRPQRPRGGRRDVRHRHPAHAGVRYLLSRVRRPHRSVMVLPVLETDGRAASLREIRANARRRRWMALIGLATAEGLGCIEGTGDSRVRFSARTPVRCAMRRPRCAPPCHRPQEPHAREVFLEYERREWPASRHGRRGGAR